MPEVFIKILLIMLGFTTILFLVDGIVDVMFELLISRRYEKKKMSEREKKKLEKMIAQLVKESKKKTMDVQEPEKDENKD